MFDFSSSLFVKQVGFFIHGVFYQRTTLAFTYAIEMVPPSWKDNVQIIINLWDGLTIVIACLYFEFAKSEDQLIMGFFIVGVMCFAVFLVIVPESPIYLLNNDPHSI